MSGLVACELKKALGTPFVVTFHALGQVRRLHQKEADQFPDVRFDVEDRIVAAGQLLLRLDQGSTEPLDEKTERAFIDRLTALYPHADAVIVSDYRYGVLTPRLVRVLADLQTRWSKVLVADSRRLAVFRDAGVTAVKPNYEEAVQLLGARTLDGFRVRAEGIAAYGERLLDLTGAQIAAVTLDSEGALVFERGRPPYRTYAQPARSCVAGAGDTFTSALGLALAAGASTAAAAELASGAAAVVVGKEGTAACSAQELREHVSAGGKYFGDLRRLQARVDFYREQGRKVVFTNGCFDILHRGHITYLNRAKALGDVLIVGVNSDESIRRIKGPSRPINTLEDRVQVLAALSSVDHLVAFDENTPCTLIRAIRPHVFVKGGDYTRERLPEAPLVEELGGVVQILPYLQDRSTTGIIERIQRNPV
jgi:D-beta-D-heptose 7-phosphate kinase/D-beta-D-heptose 1-phosphate adenosyltransferase